MWSSGADASGGALVAQPGEVRIPVLLQLAMLLMVVANLGRIPVFSSGGRDVPILVNDLAVGVVLLAGMAAMAAHRRFVVDRVVGFALLFAALGALSAVLSIPRFGLTPGEVAVSLAYLARWIFYFSLYVVVMNTALARDVEPVWRALEAAILMFAAFGIVQSAFLPDFAQLVYPESRRYYDWDPQGHRLVSTLLDPNFAGMFIVIGLLVNIARLSTGARVAAWKLLLLSVALALTVSRSSLLALIVGGFTILVIRGLSKRMLRAIGGGLVLVALASPKLYEFARAYNKFTIDASALARLTSWTSGWRVFNDHPVIGIGINTWGFVQERYGLTRLFASGYGIDGGLLFVAVMTGVVGLALYMLMLRAVYARAKRVWRNAELPAGHRGLAIGAVALIPTIIVHSIFINSLFHPHMMEALWVIWALVACADAGEGEGERERGRARGRAREGARESTQVRIVPLGAQ